MNRLRDILCRLIGHRTEWIPNVAANDETPVCARCGYVLHDGEV